ncbi:hypothetical protein VTK26DRAFT_4126 [Humicola hyalothermophila]
MLRPLLGPGLGSALGTRGAFPNSIIQTHFNHVIDPKLASTFTLLINLVSSNKPTRASSSATHSPIQHLPTYLSYRPCGSSRSPATFPTAPTPRPGPRVLAPHHAPSLPMPHRHPPAPRPPLLRARAPAPALPLPLHRVPQAVRLRLRHLRRPPRRRRLPAPRASGGGPRRLDAPGRGGRLGKDDGLLLLQDVRRQARAPHQGARRDGGGRRDRPGRVRGGGGRGE